jgi:hypothetical protein
MTHLVGGPNSPSERNARHELSELPAVLVLVRARVDSSSRASRCRTSALAS